MKVHAAGLYDPLHDDEQLKALPSKIRSTDVIEWGVLVNDMDQVKRPDKKHAGFTRGVRVHLQMKITYIIVSRTVPRSSLSFSCDDGIP